ncbi:Abi-alpha family protein [Marmoricola sp. RAF53]|uniref:Abi-alpha family protein n=1 Tax=Marmoricola sp. RAF53 TaxID=3233059 RepID=UPI003F9A4FE4
MTEHDNLDERVPAVWEGAADALPGVARIAGTAWLRSASWAVASGSRSARNLGRAMTNPAAAGELVRGVASDLAEATRAISQVATAVSGGVPVSKALFDASITLSAVMVAGEPQQRERDDRSLRERGEDLLRRSRDVWSEDEAHPAYGRILEELAPDEARILLLLLRGGPQPSVDVRTGGPVGLVSSSLVSAGLTMIGPRAGVRYLDEVPAYLNNLFRLGLVWFSREQLEDPLEYQVVEAQPDVLDAMHSVRFAKVVRRSIHLTPFGIDFCKTCLVDEDETADLPEHETPDPE